MTDARRSPRRQLPFLALLAALTLLPAGCEPAPDAEAPYNLVLITLDTVRADALGCYGDPASRTPRLDALAERALLFEQAFATAPFTGPSHASILTSQHPSAHGVVFNGGKVPAEILEGTRTLAEHLSARAFRTAAFVSVDNLRAEFGFARGFQTFAHVETPDPADESGGSGYLVNREAEEWLARNGSHRFFLWVHYFNSHLPYISAEGFHEALHVPALSVNAPAARRLDRPALADQYRVEMMETDHQVGDLLDFLDDRGLREQTVIAVVADHGEYLKEHGLIGHSHLYQEALHVPMFLTWPGRTVPERRVEPVSTVDLAPTLLQVLQQPPLPGAAGRALLGQRVSGPLYAEWRNHHMLRAGRRPQPGDFQISVQNDGWKLIRDIQYPDRPELYDLRTDPGEQRNLLDEEPDLVRELLGLLDTHVREDLPRGLAPADGVEITPEMMEKLRALGYL